MPTLLFANMQAVRRKQPGLIYSIQWLVAMTWNLVVALAVLNTTSSFLLAPFSAVHYSRSLVEIVKFVIGTFIQFLN